MLWRKKVKKSACLFYCMVHLCKKYLNSSSLPNVGGQCHLCSWHEPLKDACAASVLKDWRESQSTFRSMQGQLRLLEDGLESGLQVGMS